MISRFIYWWHLSSWRKCLNQSLEKNSSIL